MGLSFHLCLSNKIQIKKKSKMYYVEWSRIFELSMLAASLNLLFKRIRVSIYKLDKILVHFNEIMFIFYYKSICSIIILISDHFSTTDDLISQEYLYSKSLSRDTLPNNIFTKICFLRRHRVLLV